MAEKNYRMITKLVTKGIQWRFGSNKEVKPV